MSWYDTPCIIKTNRKMARYNWVKKHGPLPEGMCVLHYCDNERCVNEKHWFLGTQSDNMRDMHNKKRAWNSKLNQDQVIAIKHSNKTTRDLATEYGVTYQTIWLIRKGFHWRWIVE